MTTIQITSPSASTTRPRAARVGDAVVAGYIHSLAHSRPSTGTARSATAAAGANAAPAAAADLAGPADAEGRAAASNPAPPKPVRPLAERARGRALARRGSCVSLPTRFQQHVSA